MTASDFGIFLTFFGGSGGVTDHDGDGATTAADFSVLLPFFGGVPGPSGLDCVIGAAGGTPPCTVTDYGEIASTTSSAVSLEPPMSVPGAGDLVSETELFVFPSVGREVLARDESFGYSLDGVYGVASATTPTTVPAGSVITRWVMHAQSASGAPMAIPVETGITFDISEEVLGIEAIGAGLPPLELDGGDLFEIAGRTVMVTVPTEGIQLEVVTACNPSGGVGSRGVTFSLDQASTSIAAAASFPLGAAIESG